MFTLYPKAKLGGAHYGWLDTRYHFSFATYYNPDRMGFGALRVINDDRIAGRRGFDTHPHRDMEIITYVRSGAITHRDSAGNSGRTEAGDVQVMSAGSGVYHSEHNLEEEETTLYQIWILPDTAGVPPRWEQRKFPRATVQDALIPLVSGRVDDVEQGAIFIHQDAAIHGGRMAKDTQITHAIKHMAYILCAEGAVEINGEMMQAGDGAEVTEEATLQLRALSDAEVLVLDVPPLDKDL